MSSITAILSNRQWQDRPAPRYFCKRLSNHFAVLKSRILVVVALALGSAISWAQTAPFIASQPQNRQVACGSNAVFSVTSTGDNPGYQWYFNGSNAIVGAIGSTLILTNVQAAQAGNYSVSVSSADGATASSNAVLTVLTVTINPYAFGTLGYDLYEGTYEKAGMTNSRIASYNPNASNLGTNTAVWTWPINLSCVGYASDGWESVLITRNELLACAHYGGESGQTVTFHDTNGVPWVAIVTNTIKPIADMVIAQLSNAAPPSIVVPYVLPPDYTNYIAGHTLAGMPAFWLHKNTAHIDFAPITELGDYDWYGYGTWAELVHTNYGFSGSSATSGDSGAPAFLSWKNCPVLMFATTLSGDARGLFVSGVTNWNLLAALGLTNGMKVLDLSGYRPSTNGEGFSVTVTVSGGANSGSNYVVSLPAASAGGLTTNSISVTKPFWTLNGGMSNTNGNVAKTNADRYTVTVTEGGTGETNANTQTNYVGAPSLPAAPVAGFTGTPAAGAAPLQVVFSDASSGSITNWVWNFGDGNSITNNTDGDVTNTYAAAGNYTVTLTVSGAGGINADTQTDYVNVSSLPEAPPPTTGGPAPLQGMSDDSDESSASITLNTPASQLNVSADSVFTFSWQTTDSNPNATIALYLDVNNNPASGLIPIASGIQNGNGTSCVWQAGSNLVGTNYYAYAVMTDGTTTASSFALGQLYVDSEGAFQLLSSIEATNATYVAQYVYDGSTYSATNQLIPGANVVSVTNGVSIHQFVVTLVRSLAQVTAVQYNPLNQITTTTNGNGIVTTLTYDPLGRLVQRQSSNGALVTYRYDVLGNRTNMTDYTGTTFYRYDGLNRLTNIVTSKSGVLGGSDNSVLSYEYDLAGHETAIVYPGGERIQYTYDNAGRLLTVNNVARSLLFQYTYSPTTGQLMKLTRPNGIETDYSYDGIGRLTNILHKVTATGALVAQYGYTLDAIGKALLLTTTLPGNVIKLEQYSYDYFDRLTNVVYGDNGVINSTALSVGYTYDGNGNRLTMTTRTNSAVTEIRYYTYGAENRLLNVINQNDVMLDAYSYDPAGNRIEKVATNYTAFYTYDERNLMTSYSDSTNLMAYAYNGDGQRVSETVNGTLTACVIDPNQSVYQDVQENNSSGAVTASYTFGLSRLATWNGSEVTFELDDRIGSVRILTDPNGNVIQTYSYDVFGATR